MSIVTFKMTQRIINGAGSFAKLPEEAAALGAKRILLITGQNIFKSGLAQKTVDMLTAQGFAVDMFNDVEPDPSVETAEDAAAKGKAFKADCVIAVGGGSSLDTAKVCSVLITNEGSARSMLGVDNVKKPGVATILVPTSAGTGSEVTDLAILSDNIAKLKIGVDSRYLLPSSVLLDPELTISLPRSATAASGLDALIHAMEAYTSVRATPLTDLFAEQAIRLIAPNLRGAWARGDRLDVREAMLTGSLYAGIAFGNAGVTAVHAFAYPIGAEFHIPHGVANSIMLVPVFRFNMTGNLARFAKLAEFLGEDTQGLSQKAAAEKAIAHIVQLVDDLEVSRHLADFGVKQEHVPDLAKGVLEVKRILANNPRTLNYEEACAIYQAAL